MVHSFAFAIRASNSGRVASGSNSNGLLKSSGFQRNALRYCNTTRPIESTSTEPGT